MPSVCRRTDHGGQNTVRYRRVGCWVASVAAKVVFVSQPFPECHRASIHPLKGTTIMDATVKMVLVIALVAAVVLLLFFGGGMTTGTMSGGMMGR